MVVTKANAKEKLGEFISLAITKANAKTNLQIFICNHFCVDGRMSSSLLKRLLLMVASVVKSPTIRNFQEPPTPGTFSKVLPVQMGGVLRYKWEAYCSTNGGCTAGFAFLQGLEARKAE